MEKGLDAPCRHFCVGVSGRDDGRDERYWISALRGNSAVQNKQSGFTVDRDVRLCHFLIVRQSFARREHSEFFVAFQGAWVFLLNDHEETHFVAGAERGERAGGAPNIWVDDPLLRNVERELAGPVEVPNALEGLIDFRGIHRCGGGLRSIAGTVLRETDSDDVASLELQLAVAGLDFDFVGG